MEINEIIEIIKEQVVNMWDLNHEFDVEFEYEEDDELYFNLGVGATTFVVKVNVEKDMIYWDKNLDYCFNKK